MVAGKEAIYCHWRLDWLTGGGQNDIEQESIADLNLTQVNIDYFLPTVLGMRLERRIMLLYWLRKILRSTYSSSGLHYAAHLL